jgi:hypothetical protein
VEKRRQKYVFKKEKIRREKLNNFLVKLKTKYDREYSEAE